MPKQYAWPKLCMTCIVNPLFKSLYSWLMTLSMEDNAGWCCDRGANSLCSSHWVLMISTTHPAKTIMPFIIIIRVKKAHWSGNYNIIWPDDICHPQNFLTPWVLHSNGFISTHTHAGSLILALNMAFSASHFWYHKLCGNLSPAHQADWAYCISIYCCVMPSVPVAKASDTVPAGDNE